MFGLDARIALAIFGALSVITCVALYSAIENANSTAVLTDLNELGKAFEQYYLDTGKVPQRESTVSTETSFYVFLCQNLINKPAGVNNWRGPYLSYKLGSANSHLKYIEDTVMIMFWLKNNGTLGGIKNWWDAVCISGERCALWLHINYLPESVIINIDKKVDKGDGKESGNVRWATFNEKEVLYYKYMPLHNPHD